MNDLSVCMTVCSEKFEKSSPFFKDVKNCRIGERITMRQASFAVPFIIEAVFPSGRIAESSPETNTIPTIDKR